MALGDRRVHSRSATRQLSSRSRTFSLVFLSIFEEAIAARLSFLSSMAGKEQPAVFELSFKADQGEELDVTDVGYVEKDHPFRIRCVADDSYTDQLFVKKRNEEHLHK